ncbi:angiogenic factor with G patch and FHA domains 1-like isoform X1 [Chenopodium quinoa]|uniref:angiogenic factor with G patch and FHA domains 1-like isoform X1 n=1 Tax=Chenopodium quinoa TaxID=63459 RepID=UPI000B76CD5A|nr:angiogenic factor with G patch and FHA domains 1-like isoform X1 [Chenopodium quinoa]
MEEIEVCTGEEEAQQYTQNQEDSFVWDQNSQLYYHARSGFYHNPNEGWYYNTRDGFYYKFEDGNYILFDSYNKGYQSETEGQGESQLQAECKQEYELNYQENDDAAQQIAGECTSSELHGNPPPSEWLEETLIELYLSGYQNTASNPTDYQQFPEETNDKDGSVSTVDGNKKLYGDGDDELSMDHYTAMDSSDNFMNEEASWEEESWQAQYGQVVQPQNDFGTEFHIIDLWDWSMEREIKKEGTFPVAKLVGRLVQPSSKLHPSMPSHGRRLKTAPICKARLDLVQVRSGQVYKLRTPSARYLATLLNYDASNPTSDWGFPELSTEGTNKTCGSKTAVKDIAQQYTSSCHDPPVNEKHKTNVYRDRAAERRALHGSFGAAPEQKRSADDASPPPTEEAAAEALEMSLGAGSYAQKILKNMGWKEGEGLGKTQHGLKEPLQGIGNKGTAGLGWKSR